MCRELKLTLMQKPPLQKPGTQPTRNKKECHNIKGRNSPPSNNLDHENRINLIESSLHKLHNITLGLLER